MTGLIAVTRGDWVPLAVAAVPAVASVVAAVLSGRSARASRAAEIDATRVKDLENRLAERKYEVYRPMIDLLRGMLDSRGAPQSARADAAVAAKLSEFASWVTIFGSDDALRAFHNFMQGAFHDAPATVTLRLYAEFVLAARRDMGDSSTEATVAEVLGVRVNDLYESDRAAEALGPLPDVFARAGWEPPWEADRARPVAE